MTTESPVKMVDSAGTRKWPSLKDIATFGPNIKSKEEEEFEVLLNGWKAQTDMIPNRSGSAPPSMEGSFAAIGNILARQNLGISSTLESLGREIGNFESEEELRSDPAYFAYYCSNVNLNPRLPLPLMSSENRRLVRHIGGFGNHWKSASSNEAKNISFQLSKGSLPSHKEEPEDDVSPKDTLESSATASGQNTSFSGHYKSLVDLIQEDFSCTASPVYSQSRSSSLVPDEAIVLDINAISSNASSLKISKVAERNSGIPEVSNNLHFLEAHARERPSPHKDGSNCSSVGLEGGASIGGSSVARVESQYHPSTQWRTLGVQAQSVSQDIEHIHNNIGYLSRSHVKPSHAEVQPSLHAPTHNSTFYAAGGYTAGGPSFYPNLQPTGLYYPHYGVGAFAFGSGFVPQFVEGYPSHTSINSPFGTCSSSAGENMQHAGGFQHLGKIYGQQGFMVQPSIDPRNMQYFHQPFGDAYKAATVHNLFTINAASSQLDSFVAPKSTSTNVSDMKFQQATNGNFITPNIGGVGFAGNSFYRGSSGMEVMPQFPASPLSSLVLPSSLVGGINHLSRPNSMSFPQGLSRNAGPFLGGQGQRGLRIFDDTKRHSFLEELRSSNAGKVELQDIAGHIVELSMDQHGSRFIQQKLECCSVEEKLSVFKEALPHSSKLMTDVFGNYVIQKFFEHGSPEQRKELADKLSGQMLHLSLQMYGCRVIQKALEAIQLDQKTRLVQELDGHVINCVHDQNGNHVIQKCIECVPAENIQFIISAFQGQVATLSTHPYGCRVIQRVLEHCLDDAQSGSIVDEILESVDVLARDQYGNYVTQHVLERGKHDERRQIISKLSGKIVQMSQHKFASNVIEKCLQYGNPADRDLLIQEIVGQSEGNDNLLIMMKDQFANYVVQKILEICNDEQKKTLLNCIRSHLHALRKYTYGKHIVARFEKLCDKESQTLES